jgi:hypothetical protein
MMIYVLLAYIVFALAAVWWFYCASERRCFTDEDEADDLREQSEYLERMK